MAMRTSFWKGLTVNFNLLIRFIDFLVLIQNFKPYLYLKMDVDLFGQTTGGLLLSCKW